MPNNYRTIQSKRRKKKTDSAPSDTTTQPGKAFNYSHWFAVPLTVYVLQIDSFIIDNWSMLKKHLPEITQTRTPRNPSPFIICSQKKKHIMSPHPTQTRTWGTWCVRSFPGDLRASPWTSAPLPRRPHSNQAGRKPCPGNPEFNRTHHPGKKFFFRAASVIQCYMDPHLHSFIP